MAREIDKRIEKFITPPQGEGAERRVDVLDLVRMTKENADSIKELGADFKHGMEKLTGKLEESTVAVTRLTVTMEHVQAQSAEHVVHRNHLDERIRQLENHEIIDGEKRIRALELSQGRTLLAASSIGGIVGFGAGVLLKWLTK